MSLLALVFAVSGLYIPLALLDEPAVFQAFSAEQRAAVGYLALSGFFRGWSVALFLFGGFCIGTGVLILRARMIQGSSEPS